MSSQDSSQNGQSVVNKVASTIIQSAGAQDSNDLVKYYGTAAAAGVVTAGALYYYMNGSKKDSRQPIIDFKNQTRTLEDGARILSISLTDKVFTRYYDDAATQYELFLKATKLSNDGNYLGHKPSPNEPYVFLKYSECGAIAHQLGSSFIDYGIEAGKENFVGIFAKNRPEWILTDLACHTFSFVNVPLYDTLGHEAISFILAQTQLKLVVCDDSPKALQLLNCKSNLEYIIVIEDITEEAREKASNANIKLFSWKDVIENGKKSLKKPVPPTADTLTTICYTSGTTGTPKGALITHGNIIAVASSMLVYVKNHGLTQDGKERYLSYLPLAHMFERVCQATIVSLAGSIGFYQGDIKKLVEDMKEVKPTIFCTVPRLLNRIYSKVVENIDKSSPIKKAIFKFAFAQKEKEVLKGITRNNSCFDFAFKQIRATLGGEVKFVISGSAPIAPEVLHFLRVVSGCYVLEGYGATETGGASGVQLPGETTVGNVGPPFLCSLYKLIDVPEMGLVANRDNKGEICIAGSNIFKGYYKDEEKTKDALRNGWYHTGDIGSFVDNGCLKVVDRVKNIFKLQQGEYIAPEKIENLYTRSKYVAQVFVYGNSYKSSLVAVMVPEQTVVDEWAREQNIETSDFKALCAHPELKKLILKDVTQIGKNGGLKGFEQVRDFYLHHDLFSVENGLLTPTMKSKRIDLLKHFKTQIDALYANLD